MNKKDTKLNLYNIKKIKKNPHCNQTLLPHVMDETFILIGGMT